MVTFIRFLYEKLEDCGVMLDGNVFILIITLLCTVMQIFFSNEYVDSVPCIYFFLFLLAH
jgi:hypothetical protein